MNSGFNVRALAFAALTFSACLGQTDHGLSEELIANLDKWDALHRSNNHCAPPRMRKIAECMDPENPNRPSLCTLKRWIEHRKCGACLLSKQRKPPQAATHPRVPRQERFIPGEFLHVDGIGAYNDVSDSGLEYTRTIDGTKTSLVITDDSSHAISIVPIVNKGDDIFMETMEQYEQKSGIKIKKIRADGEFVGKTTLAWASKRGIDLTGSAPRTQQQNGMAESSVGIMKNGYRTARSQACTSNTIISQGLVTTSQQHNRCPSDRDPEGKHRSPLEQFPTLPWEHKTLPVAPWGCRCFPYIGKSTQKKDSHARSLAGIYLGHDRHKAGHLVLNLATNTIETHAYVHVEPHRFPFRELQLAGEHPVQDFDPDTWRKYAPQLPDATDDRALGEFFAGKQLTISLPREQYYSEYPADWRVKAHSLVEKGGCYALKCIFSDYKGDKETLSATDKQTLSGEFQRWIEIPISDPKTSGKAFPKAWDTHGNLRSLLKAAFPTATTLADYATLSTLEQGSIPSNPFFAPPSDAQVSDAPKDVDQADKPPPLVAPPPDEEELTDADALERGVSSSSEDQSGPAAPAIKQLPCIIVTPATRVGRTRSSKSTLKPSKSNMIPDRQLRTRVLRPSTMQQSKARAMLSRIAPGQGVILIPREDGKVGFEPANLKEAENHETWPLWRGAMQKETQGLKDRGTFTPCRKEDVPEGVTIMGSQFVYKDKRVTGAKARIVVRGDQQFPKPDGADTYAATPSPTEVRTIISIAVQNNYALHSLDISQAFVQADELPEDSNLYIYPPKGSNEPPGTIWKLRRPLYGLAVAPRAWSDTLKRFLVDYGFVKVNNSDTSYIWSDPTKRHHMHLVYHVDDILLAFSDDKHGSDFKRALLARFKGSDEGALRRYLGIDISRDAKQLHLSQQAYALETLERFGMLDCNPCAAPLEAGYTISKTDCPEIPDPKRRLRFQEITGSLQFLVQWTRPDLSFSTNELAKVNSNPSEEHLQMAYRVLKYLKGTAHLGLTYTRDLENPNQLIGWADADFAACTDTRRSISAYVLMLNGAAVSWKSRQQKSVATSTSQAEFVSASWAADEILWLRRSLAELHVPQKQATPLYEDNRACRMMSENPVHRERSKHIDYRVHSLRERVADGVVRLLDCPTVDMVADMGTKSLPAPAHARHRDTAMGLLRHTSPKVPADLSKRGGGGLS